MMMTDKQAHRHRSPASKQTQYLLEGNVDELEARLGYLNEQYQLRTTFQFEGNQIEHEEYQKVMKLCREALGKAGKMGGVEVAKVLRVIDPMIEQVLQDIMTVEPTSETLMVLSVVLQYTDRVNYSVLTYLIANASTVDTLLLKSGFASQATLETLFRFFEAQPYLLKVWNAGPLFEPSLDYQDAKLKFLLVHLRSKLAPGNAWVQDHAQRLKSLEALEYLESLRMSKREEAHKQREITQLFTSQEAAGFTLTKKDPQGTQSQVSKKGRVMSTYLQARVDLILNEMERDVFRHFSVNGDEGSGKMSFVELLSDSFHNQGEVEPSTKLIVVTLEETFDSKNLVGTYVCNESGEFVFKKGPLTVAAEEGFWLVLRHIEKAPSDLLSFLLPLVQENVLQVTAEFSIVPKLGFRIFALCHQTTNPSDDIKPFMSLLGGIKLDKLMDLGAITCLEREDFETEILPNLYPLTFAVSWLPKMLLDSVRLFLHPKLNQLKPQMLDFKPLSVRQVFKTFARTEAFLKLHYSIEELADPQFFLSTNARMALVEDQIDVYLGYFYDTSLKHRVIQELIATIWNTDTAASANLDPHAVADHITQNTRQFGISSDSCYFGRSQNIKRVAEDAQMDDDDGQEKQRRFVYTATTLRLMEQIAMAIGQQESSLLVGETGTGKTTSVQELAKILGKKLHVFNMNQNTDSSDLLGGFKPVDLKFLLKPLYELFLSVFKAEFKNLEKNKKFLDLTQKCYEENKVREFLQCLNHGLTAVRGKKNFQMTKDVQNLEDMVAEVTKRAQKLENGGGFIFQFIEGTLIKSIKEGEWILLDEINLASESVLNRLATLIDGDYILLNERADIVETKRHNDFRLFLCMNPPYTSAGKKQLPWSLRSKLTEIYVPELNNQNDLWMIIDRNCSNQINEAQKRKILEFYIRVREQVMRATKRGNIGLRNLSRSLAFMKSAISLKYPPIKAIYDSLYTCFASHLDPALQKYISQTILELFEITHLPKLAHASELHLSDRYIQVEQFIIPKGVHPNHSFDEKDFVTTKSFKSLLKQLAGVVAVSDYAVILQGPTSAGKTSTVQYLANITQNKVIRINNHMHTDIQEYLGSYVPDKEGGGKLIFQEGVLVEAVRNGYWVILDELNLAPSEVLEALNRLLDDNRELLIVETQKVIKAHPNFRIFATQNPTEGYGGRKELSEAFKNRFILINVHDVPLDELVEILINKCQLPKSRAELMVKVMEQLQIYRSQGSNLFSGKDSTITVRDLLKWASRLTHQSTTSSVHDLAIEGYFVLGERSRNEMDKLFIKETIEKVAKVKIEDRQYYEDYFAKNLAKQFSEIPQKLDLPRLIQSQQLKRLAVLVHKCLLNQEPVLLVGETGCGKTTLCQVFAAIGDQQLFSINCHQNTETSDFIGCMRTRKNLKQTQDLFVANYTSFLQTLGIEDVSPYVLEDDSSLKTIRTRFSALSKHLKTQSISEGAQGQLSALKALRDDLTCIFEWHDGILVEAMQQGGLLLIDEISLANDSVLERLNSVFEADRTLMISEKSSKEAVKVVGHPKFKMVATMNPSGDFGKKELSPALRNRMTEIWVESYFHQTELVGMYKSVSASNNMFLNVPHSVDLYLIILETASDKLKHKIRESVHIENLSIALFNMIGYVNFVMAQQFFALQRKSLSIRDILSIIDFIQVTIDKVFNFDLVTAFKHAVSLVIIDGLCLGIDVSGDRQKAEILKMCDQFLLQIDHQVFGVEESRIDYDRLPYISTQTHLGVQPFQITKMGAQIETSYAFDARTTKVNLLKLLRAYELNKPILIEGPPGVGKTSLVEHLAKVTGRKLIRVNLSEQTDMMDLLGSEYPVQHHDRDHKDPSNAASDKDDDDIRFHWCDGVLLQAIKEGHWFLIDEMNLAQQSVLEGLNAILDHRRTVYIPELNQEFKCHPNFFVFACQNPSQSATSVGGRKTLPKSFLNRFNKIFLEDLTQEDYQCIIERQIKMRGSQAEAIDVERLLHLSRQVETLIRDDHTNYQEEGEINMRDLSRFLNLFRTFLRQDGVTRDQSIIHAFKICYLQRLSSGKHQNALELLMRSGMVEHEVEIKRILQDAQVVRIDEQAGNLTFLNPLKPTKVQLSTSHQHSSSATFTLDDFQNLKGPHSIPIQYVLDCLQSNLPLLLISNDPQRLLSNLQTISQATGQTLNRILLNERSDTSQLLGCFEQTTTSDIGAFLKQVAWVKETSQDGQVLARVCQLEKELGGMLGSTDPMRQVEEARRVIHGLNGRESQSLRLKLDEVEVAVRRGGSSRFEWVDSVLVKAIVEGQWVVFENANLCNPSILDRLNPLLEEGNHSLCINEQGLTEGDKLRDIKAHPDFRSIFVINSHTLLDLGKDVSRALRNRCLQVSLFYQSTEDAQELTGDQRIIDTRLMQLQTDLKPVRDYHLEHKLTSYFQDLQQFTGLGKRSKKSGIQNEVINRVLSYQSTELEAYFQGQDRETDQRTQKAYLHFLACLLGKDLARSILEYASSRYPTFKQQISQIHDHLLSVSPWQSHLSWRLALQLTKLRTLLQGSQLFNRSTQAFLTYLLQAQNSDFSEDVLTLMREVRFSLKQRDFNAVQGQKNIYLMIRGGLREVRDFLQSWTQQHGSHADNLVVKVMLDSLENGIDLESVAAFGPNRISPESSQLVKKLGQKLDELNQQPVQICVKNIQTGQSAVGIEGMLAMGFVILMLSEDKVITRITPDNMRTKLDPYVFQDKLGSPYLVLIPPNSHSANHQDILISQSSLYPALCHLNDLLRLSSQAPSLTLPFLKRHTALYPALSLPSLPPHARHFLTALASQHLRTLAASGFEHDLLDRVLDSTRTARLRDLPAFLLASQKLQRAITKYAATQQQHAPTPALCDGLPLVQALSHTTQPLDLTGSQVVSEYLQIEKQSAKAQETVANLSQCLALLPEVSSHLLSALRTLYLIPLELSRLEAREGYAREHQRALESFVRHHYKSEEEASRQSETVRFDIQQIQGEYTKIAEMRPQGEAEGLVKYAILLVEELAKKTLEVTQLLQTADRDDTVSRLKDLASLTLAILIRAVNQQQLYLHFNHLLTGYLTLALSLVTSLKQVLQRPDQVQLALERSLVSLRPMDASVFSSQAKEVLEVLKKDGRARLHEIYLKYLLKQKGQTGKHLRSAVLDYFVHREVVKRIVEEERLAELDELVYKLPFKMKMQTLMEDNKPIDERTKEDVEKMEKEAKQEIERNFPSYFDEFQRLVFSGEVDAAANSVKERTREGDAVKVEKILHSMLNLDSTETPTQNRRSMVKLRLTLLSELFTDAAPSCPYWLSDVQNYLREELTHQTLPSVMNVADVRLHDRFNFYHDPLAHETRLVFEPLQKLIHRCDLILQEYESPILQDVIFLANYMLTTFSPKSAPLMKILTGLELVLNKLEEWEVYASKSLNSCQNEMTLLKQLIIRYRKIQILSWRNLLQWKKTEMMHEDFRENFLRLAHTVERQVFDRQYYIINQGEKGQQSVESKIMQVLDLFMRDSSLGQFQARISFLELLLEHFKAKAKVFFGSGSEKVKDSLITKTVIPRSLRQQMLARLTATLNILEFVSSYYGQFRERLQSTIARLDANARDKIKTLIDVSKWTVQKFAQVKNNIDKRHRQLNKACKQEEEAIMQNVAHLVLTGSRKKYVQPQEGLATLQAEGKTLGLFNFDEETPVKFDKIQLPPTAPIILSHMSLLETKKFEPLWPDCLSVDSTVSHVLFARLKIVRDINKRHIQRRAFIDLLKYLKDQGLQHNFQSDLHPLVQKTKLVAFRHSPFPPALNPNDFKRYYLKAHELLMMLENASEAQNATPAHLRNQEIIRVRGFSQSLMMRVLEMNAGVRALKASWKAVERVHKQARQAYITPIERGTESDINGGCIMGEVHCKTYATLLEDYETLLGNLHSVLPHLSLLSGSTQEASPLPTLTPPSAYLSPASLTALLANLSQLSEHLIKHQAITADLRTKRVLGEDYLRQLHVLAERALALRVDTQCITDGDREKVQKRVRLLQKKAQLFVQDAFRVMQEAATSQAARKDSNVQSEEGGMGSTVDGGNQSQVTAAPLQQEEERVELTIKEYQEFTQKVQSEVVGKHIPELEKLASKIFTFRGVSSVRSQEVAEDLEFASHLVQRVSGLLRFIMENSYIYLRSLAKFAFISQRIFIYLIFEGFCGEDDKEEDQKQQEQEQEDEKYLDGMGMGDGKGGKENVSKEIEHEEQLEGLKNYESDQEKDEKQEEEKEEQKDEDKDNDFEMQNDFSGDLEDKPDDEQEENKSEKDKDESDEDDALDEVDDLLDNKLWNENMKDLEDREQEEDEQKKDEKDKKDNEVDLGERELDQENQVPQKKEKEMTAGDHDKQDEKDGEGDDQEDYDEQNIAEEDDAGDNEDQKDEDQEEENGDDIPLDRDPNVLEDLPEEEQDKDDESMDSASAMNEEEEHSQAREDEDQVDSQYSDAQEDQDLQSEGSGENDEYKRDVDQGVVDMEDQQFEEDKQDQRNKQTNVSKPKNVNENQQQKSKQNQSDTQQTDQQTQFDVEGSDIMYQLANKLKNKQQPQNNQSEPPSKGERPEKKEDGMKEIDHPDMNPEQQEKNPDDDDHPAPDDGQEAMEYEFDRDQVEQLQGRLATDKLNDQQENLEQVPVPNEEDDERMQEEENQVERTTAEAKREQGRVQKATDAKQEEVGEETKGPDGQERDAEMGDGEGGEEAVERKLIDEYQQYLQKRQSASASVETIGGSDQLMQPVTFTFDQGEAFDYGQARAMIRELFQTYHSDPDLISTSQQLLQRFKQETSTSAASLCEQLRIVLEPQLSQQLQGDYKTGKRLNMKKVISFIASHYRNDKIWLRRTLPSKRDYKILVAIDDTLSMREGGLGFFSLEALTTITEALNRLEVGKVAVAAIRDRMTLLQTFEEGAQLSNERSSFVLSQFGFQFSAPKSADFAMANFVRDANQLLDQQNTSGGDAMNLPFVIILSDGRFNKNNVRQYLAEAREKRYLYIFVILDSVKEVAKPADGAKKGPSQSDGSILSMKSVEKTEGQAGIKLVPYLKDFPFEYYCIVRDVQQLPAALGNILVQWFSLINNGGAAGSR